MTPQQQVEAALTHHRANRLREAEAIYRQILAVNPNHAQALHLLGIIENQNGRRDSALQFLQRAIAVNPNVAAYYDDLGIVLGQLSRADEALTAHRKAVEIDPKHGLAHFNLGNALMAKGKTDEAIPAYRNAVAINPQHANAHQNLGTALHRKGDRDEAEASLRKAIELQPKSPDAYNNLGTVLASKMRLDEAIAAFNAALKLNPNFVPALSNLGAVLRTRGFPKDAIDVLRKTIQLAPNLPEPLNNLSNALKDIGQLDEAMDAGLRCLALRPTMPDAWNNLGTIHKECGDIAESIACYGRSLALAPDPGIHSNLCYTLQFHAEYDDEALYREQRRWNEIHAAPLSASIPPHPNDRSPDRKLRIGYVSAYFYSQAESFFVVPLLEKHDHEKFEIHCYASVVRPDQITRRFKATPSVWHDALSLKHADLAEQIRRDGIDILVDLSMHMALNRMPLFARKPAPVQVAWLAYPGGTGLDAMDFRITDSFMDPPQKQTTFYREQSIRLPNCWCCYDPMCDIPPAAKPPDGPIVFGSINNPCKNNEPLLRLWSRVMRAVPDSRLLMQALSETHRRKILALFQSNGIAPNRIEFVARKQRLDYLRAYDAIDICLDPLPYNGITTTCDALWMGVPVVTLIGKTAAGRAGLSILSTVGLPELIAKTDDEFVDITTNLAGDRNKLTHLRSTLREQTRKSPLMDAAQFARDMEAAYRQMWQRWVQTP